MNNKGYVTLASIFLMKLVFVLGFGLTSLLYIINQKNAVDNICHQHLLASQKILVDGNNHLMALNPLARALQIKKKALKEIQMASPPPVAAAAAAARLLVIASQNVLKLKQNGIKFSSNLLSKKEILTLKLKIKTKLGKWKYFWKNNSYVHSSINVFWNPTQIQIDQDDIAPTYKRGSHHWKSQGSHVYWSFNLHHILPTWLKNILQTNKRIYGQCASHPHKGVYLWTPAIGKGNH